MRPRLLTITLIAALAAGTQRPDSALASDPPMCMPATVATVPGVPVNVQTNCVDAGLNPTVTVVTQPTSGTLTGLPGQYVPSAGFHGTDHLTYTATGQTSAQTAINVVVNSTLACADGTATTRVGTPLKLTFPCTDADGDAVLIRAEDGRHGIVDPDVGHELTYTPDPEYVGTDVITFVGIDGAFVTASHTLTITVTPAPAATATPSATAPPTPSASSTPVPSTPPGPTPAADKTAPTVTVKATKTRNEDGVTLTLKANEAGTAKLTMTAGKNTATKSITLANGTTKVTIKLSARARKALMNKKSVKAKLTIVAADAAGNRTTKKLSVTLKR
jgi:large repetitive protein